MNKMYKNVLKPIKYKMNHTNSIISENRQIRSKKVYLHWKTKYPEEKTQNYLVKAKCYPNPNKIIKAKKINKRLQNDEFNKIL